MSATQTMNFFEHQDAARRQTSLLVGYYVLAVMMIMVAVYLVFAATFMGVESKQSGEIDYSLLWKPDIFLAVVGATLLIVLLGSLTKISQLSGGGKAVAEMMGGRLIVSGTRDAEEKKTLNVVSEMAIASGVPVPPVYLLEREQGINAFAAGFAPGDAIVAVTRGCMTQLTRDELQGVIAHEFSHIHNGDMRLNIRLVGVLHGILVIALIGYWIMRLTLGSGRRHRSSSNEKGGGAVIAIGVFGLLIMIIGYVGVFFGKLIKSAVSRQREFLADASAVQFTRNPEGISGALKKIGGLTCGSRIENSHAEEASHFFFSNGLASSFMEMMATHPPLEERIKRLDPACSAELRGAVGSGSQSDVTAGFAGGGSVKIQPASVMESIGAPGAEHIEYASTLLASIPERLREAAGSPFGARAVIYGLLINKEGTARELQLKRLSEHADDVVCKETFDLIPLIEKLDASTRLPLADLSLGALKSLSANQYVVFGENLQVLVAADEQIDLFEYTLQRMIKRHLEPTFTKAGLPNVIYKNIKEVKPDCLSLFSIISHWGSDGIDQAKQAFARGADKVGFGSSAGMNPLEQCGLQALDDSLNKLEQASSGIKWAVLDGCAECVCADGEVRVAEAELLRAIADALGCPMPPLLADQ